MLKFKVSDNVKVMSGKDKGRSAKVEKILPVEGKAVIEGINLFKKHVKGFGDVKGGIYDVARPVPFSKIALECPKCKKITRVGFKLVGSEKVRICKKCGKEIDAK